LKNDIKTKSTDFLPQKPGLISTPATATTTDAPTPAPATTLAASDLPPGAPAPSKHVIDLKNNTPSTSSVTSPEPTDTATKNNPFLLGKKSPEEIKVTPAPAAPAADSANAEAKLPDAPMPESSKTAEPNTSAIDAKQAEPGTAPNMDLAHPESDQPAEKDSLKEAMVSDDATSKKPKKKLPTWLLVLIIVVAVILIGIITFAVLNAVARPTGL